MFAEPGVKNDQSLRKMAVTFPGEVEALRTLRQSLQNWILHLEWYFHLIFLSIKELRNYGTVFKISYISETRSKAVEQNFRIDIRNLRKMLTQNPLLKLIFI